jgi:hypothetical protein
VWVLGPQRERARYTFAVFEGSVREVYEIEQWLRGGSTFYTRPAKDVRDPARWEFVGRLAPEPIRRRYIDRDVSAYLTSRNPISLREHRPLIGLSARLVSRGCHT